MIRELDQRTGDGISVTLLWSAQTNRVFISVLEQRHGVAFEFEVAAADALDAFHHPYAYAEHDRTDGALWPPERWLSIGTCTTSRRLARS